MHHDHERGQMTKAADTMYPRSTRQKELISRSPSISSILSLRQQSKIMQNVMTATSAITITNSEDCIAAVSLYPIDTRISKTEQAAENHDHKEVCIATANKFKLSERHDI